MGDNNINNSISMIQQHGDVSNTDSQTADGSPQKTVELYAVCAFLVVLCVVGTVGNAVVLWVFWDRRNRVVATLFIVVLAAVDFSTSLVVIPFTVYMESIHFRIGDDSICKLYQFLITSNIPCSAFIMVAIAVDRYLCICHPFLRVLTVRRAKIGASILALCACALGVCVALMHGVLRQFTVELPIYPAAAVDDVLDRGVEMDAATSDDGLMSGAGGAEGDGGGGEGGMDCQSSLSIADDGGVNFTKQTCVINMGVCHPNEMILSAEVTYYFKIFYNSLFLVSLIIVIVLYAFIYHSVLVRRSRRTRQRIPTTALSSSASRNNQPAVGGGRESFDCPPRRGCATPLDDVAEQCQAELDELGAAAADKDAERNGGCGGEDDTRTGSGKGNRRTAAVNSKLTLRERYRLANLKTAGMLFVVTVVFVVTFLPAFLMTLQLVPYHIFVFYLYFANNIANPFIYSFMNKNFRDELRPLFCRRCQALRCSLDARREPQRIRDAHLLRRSASPGFGRCV